MSVSATEVQALKQFALGESQGQLFSFDATNNSLILKPRGWAERLQRVLWTLITFGRRDGFADMRWLLIAQTIRDKADALFAAIQASALSRAPSGAPSGAHSGVQSNTGIARVRSGLRSKVMAGNASFRASHPGWEQKPELADRIRAIDTWLGRSSYWRPSESPATN